MNLNSWQLFLAFLGLVTSIYSCYHVIRKLELNKVIKGLLIGMTVSQLVSFFNIFICNIGLIAGVRNTFVCFYSILSGTLLFSGSLIFNSSISWARFYITWKTHHQKYPKTFPIICGTTLVYFSNLINSTTVLGVQAYYENPGAITSCIRYNNTQDEERYKKSDVKILPILAWILPILLIACVGIVGDLALKNYLQTKQTTGQQATLVPWKSGPQQGEQYKATIPIRATLLTVSTSLTWTLGLCPIFLAMGFNQFVFIGLLAYEVIQVPMIIAWTAKLNRKVHPAPQMDLNQLHFHDEEPRENDE